MPRLIGWLFGRLARWPLWLLHALGVVVGWATYALSPAYRRRLDAHARLAGVPPAQRRAAVAHAGRGLMELPRLWLRPSHEAISPPPRWSGTGHIEAAHAAGRGIVFLTPHLGAFEVTAQGYAERYGAVHPVTVLYRPARKAWLRALVDTARGRPGLSAAPATLAGVRQMIRALRRGEAVGLLPDQVPPEGMGVWAPFFGRPAYTMTLAARLAQQTGRDAAARLGRAAAARRRLRAAFLALRRAAAGGGRGRGGSGRIRRRRQPRHGKPHPAAARAVPLGLRPLQDAAPAGALRGRARRLTARGAAPHRPAASPRRSDRRPGSRPAVMSRAALGLLWLLHWLPLALLAPLGVGLGRLLHAFAGGRRRVALRNLELCLPELPEAERRALARRHFEWLGRSILERGLLFHAPCRGCAG